MDPKQFGCACATQALFHRLLEKRGKGFLTRLSALVQVFFCLPKFPEERAPDKACIVVKARHGTMSQNKSSGLHECIASR